MSNFVLVQFKQQHSFYHAKPSTLHCVCICVIDRSRKDEGSLSDSDSSPQWCGIAMSQNAPGSESESSTPSEPGATVKSLIKSFDTAVKSEDSHFLTFSLPFHSFNLFWTSYMLPLSAGVGLLVFLPKTSQSQKDKRTRLEGLFNALGIIRQRVWLLMAATIHLKVM